MPVPKKTSAEALSLRITVIDPPPNILWALQLGRGDLVKPALNIKDRISFDFTVGVVEDSSPAGLPRRGPAGQGRPGERFVYLCIGRLRRSGRRPHWLAHQDWARRGKPQASGSGEGKTFGRIGSAVRWHGAEGWPRLRNGATVGGRLARCMKQYSGNRFGGSRE